MARWRYDENGNKIMISKFDIRSISSIKTLFPSHRDYSMFLKYKNKINNSRDATGFKDRIRAVKHIFMLGFKLMLERVAKGDIFIIGNSYGSHVLLQPYSEGEVEALRRHGAYSDVDMIATRWRLPMFILRLRPNTDSNKYDRRISPTKAIAKIATTELEKGNINFDTLIG